MQSPSEASRTLTAKCGHGESKRASAKLSSPIISIAVYTCYGIKADPPPSGLRPQLPSHHPALFPRPCFTPAGTPVTYQKIQSTATDTNKNSSGHCGGRLKRIRGYAWFQVIKWIILEIYWGFNSWQGYGKKYQNVWVLLCLGDTCGFYTAFRHEDTGYITH